MDGRSIPLPSISVSLVKKCMFLWCLFNVTDINEVYEQSFFNEISSCEIYMSTNDKISKELSARNAEMVRGDSQCLSSRTQCQWNFHKVQKAEPSSSKMEVSTGESKY